MDNRKVYVNGNVLWGEDYINVDTTGVLLDWCGDNEMAFVNLEYISGDINVWTYVNKDFIKFSEHQNTNQT